MIHWKTPWGYLCQYFPVWRSFFGEGTSFCWQTHHRLTNIPLPCRNLNHQKNHSKAMSAEKPRLVLAASEHRGSATLNPRELWQCSWLLPSFGLGETLFKSESTTGKTICYQMPQGVWMYSTTAVCTLHSRTQVCSLGSSRRQNFSCQLAVVGHYIA